MFYFLHKLKKETQESILNEFDRKNYQCGFIMKDTHGYLIVRS